MVRLTRIYTRGGDAGETHLGDMSRVGKTHARVEAFGDVDEANSVIGVARALGPDVRTDGWLRVIQNDLFDVGADLSVPEDSETRPDPLRITQGQVDRLEGWCDLANEDLDPLTSFILPGGTPVAASLHAARAVCRRAERRVVALSRDERVNPRVLAYLNRLSDLLFILARTANRGSGDVLWEPGAGRGR